MFDWYHMDEKIAKIKEQFPVGTRVELISMDDPQSLPAGTRGTVKGIDGVGDLLMSWDTGSSLKLIYGEDRFKVIHDD